MTKELKIHLSLTIISAVILGLLIVVTLWFMNYLEEEQARLMRGDIPEVVVFTSAYDVRCYYKAKTGQECWSNSWDVRNQYEKDNPRNDKMVKFVERNAKYLQMRNWVRIGSIGFVD